MSAPAATRAFGDTGLLVSPLGLGAGQLDSPGLDDAGASRLLDTALELGVTFVDTARSYGSSERRLGRWLPAHRDRVVVSTKVGSGVAGVPDWSGEAVTRGVHDALRLLDTDVLDVVFLHSCPLAVLRRGDAAGALLACRDAGLVRVAGYSGENAELAHAASSGLFGALQTSVNLADQRSAREVLPAAEAAGLGVVAKRPLANAPWRWDQRPTGVYGETYWERLRTMGIEPGDGDWARTALRFAAHTPGVSTAIVGTSNPDNLRAAAEAVAAGPLPADERARWEAAFAPHAADWPGEV